MTHESDIILKIFSGPHLGAELPLLYGRTVVGSQSSCDLIIDDSTVLNRHFVIHVPEQSQGDPAITVEPLDGPVFLTLPKDKETPAQDHPETGPPRDAEETPVEGVTQKINWDACIPLMAGTTCMAWQKKGGSWGDIVATGVFAGDTAAEDEPKDEAIDPEETEKDPFVFGKWTKRLLRLFVVLIFFGFLFGPCMGGKSTRDARNMRSVLKKNNFVDLVVDQTDLGVVIAGKVKTRQERKNLWQIAGGRDYPVFIDVSVEEERSFAVKVALSVRGLFPEVSLENKDILMKGYMRDKLIEGASKIWIKQDITNIGQIKSSMVYGSQVWPVLKNRLIFHKLAKFVVVRFHPGLVQIEGELDFDQRQTLETLKGEVCDSLNSPIAFWDTLTAPGFSNEWNKSLNASLRSKYAPDPGLAQLFLDSQSAKGVPAFSAATPALKASGSGANTTQNRLNQRIVPGTTAPSQGFDMDGLQEKIKKGKKQSISKKHDIIVLDSPSGKDEDKVAVLVDKDGNVVLGPDGKPILLPPVLGKDGKVLRDKDGNIIFAQPLTDKDGNLVLGKPGPVDGKVSTLAKDNSGRTLVDEDGRPVVGEVLKNPDGTVKTDKDGNILVKRPDGTIVKVRPVAPAKDDLGRVLLDEDGRPVMGEVLQNPDGTVKTDKDGNILVRRPDGTIVKTRPSDSAVDDSGRLLVDKDGRVVEGEVLRNPDGTVKRDADGNILVKRPDGTIVKARPFAPAKDDSGRVLVDQDGRPVMGEVLKNPDGTVKTDKDGNILVRRPDGTIVKTRPFGQEELPVMTGPVTDGEGRVVYDKQGNPVMGRAAVDEYGNVIRDKEGNPVVLGVTLDKEGKPLRDKNDALIPLVVAKDAEGHVVYDQDGNPVIVPALLDEDGAVVRDRYGNPVSPVVVTTRDKKAAKDKRGNIILDEDANKILARKNRVPKPAGVLTDQEGGKDSFSVDKQAGGEKIGDDTNLFGSGTSSGDKIIKEKEEDPLGGLTILGVNIAPVPFVSMSDGQKFFTGGKLPSGYVIIKIKTDALTLIRKGKTKIYKMRQE